MISNYNLFKIIAIILGVLVFIWICYDLIKSYEKVNKNYVDANNSFLKKDYLAALNSYKMVSDLEPENLYAIEGQARSLMRLKKYNDSEETFKLVLSKDENFLPALTNIAILYDTKGEYDKAIIYYRRALKQDSKIAKGMSWLKRFLKNIQFKPSTVEERLIYLERQLNLDSEERKLKNKSIDNMQPDFQIN